MLDLAELECAVLPQVGVDRVILFGAAANAESRTMACLVCRWPELAPNLG